MQLQNSGELHHLHSASYISTVLLHSTLLDKATSNDSTETLSMKGPLDARDRWVNENPKRCTIRFGKKKGISDV